MPTIYILSPIDAAGHATVRSYASEEAARAATTKDDYIFDHPAEILLPRNVMCDYYNAVTGGNLKKFATKEIGAQRLFDAMKQHAFAADPAETSTLPRASQPEQQDPVALYDKVAEASSKPTVAQVVVSTKSKPGVISAIIEILKAGGGTTTEIYEELRKRFPERGEGMKTTVTIQVKRLAKQGKLVVTATKVEDRGTVYSAEK